MAISMAIFLDLYGLASGFQRSSSKLFCCRVIFTHWITYYVSSGMLNLVYLLNPMPCHAKVCMYISKTTLGISFLYNMPPDKFVQYSFS